jgi:hypothetical protein
MLNVFSLIYYPFLINFIVVKGLNLLPAISISPIRPGLGVNCFLRKKCTLKRHNLEMQIIMVTESNLGE